MYKFLTALLIFGTIVLSVIAQNNSSGELLIPRYGLTAVSDGKWIYVYGGAPHGGRNGKDFMYQGLHASIERINPISLKSEYFSSGLHRRANHASVLSDNKLITCGGRTQFGLERPKMKSCEFLDFSTGIFRELAPIPEAVRTLGMVDVANVLYVIGGVKDGPGYSKNTYRLQENSRKWERLSDAPFEVSGQAVAFKNKIYILGGYNGKAMKSVMVFDTKTMQWERLKDLPYPLSAYSAVSDGKSIFLFGDYNKMDTIHRYDPKTQELFLLDEKITPRRHTAAVIVNKSVYVIGGNQSSSGMALKLIEKFALSKLSNGGKIISKKNNKL